MQTRTDQETPNRYSPLAKQTIPDRIVTLKEKYMTVTSRNRSVNVLSRRSTSDNKATTTAYFRKISSRQRGAVKDQANEMISS